MHTIKIFSSIKNKQFETYQMKYWNTGYVGILGLDSLKFIQHKLKSNQ